MVRLSSSMMGNSVLTFWVSSMSLIQLLCDSTPSTEIAATLQFRLAHSSLNRARVPSSVVHTGVKSAGYLEKKLINKKRKKEKKKKKKKKERKKEKKKK